MSLSIEQRVTELAGLYERGRLTEALALGGTLARQFPDATQVHNVLGLVNARLGRTQEAAAAFTRALQIAPQDPDANNNLGALLWRLDRSAEAAACFGRAVQARPDFADAHRNLGNALVDLGKRAEAVACYRKALQLEPDFAEAHYNLGNVLRELGRSAEAVDHHRRAVQIRPDFAEAHNNLGDALRDIGRPAEAVECYNRALRRLPDSHQVLCNLGHALQDIGRTEEAVASYRQAVRLRPDYADARYSLGDALIDLGRTDEAGSCFAEVLRIDPGHAQSHRQLSGLKTFGAGDPEIHRMQQLLERPGLAAADRMHLSFALGKAYDDIGDYDRAFACLAEGNGLAKAQLRYDMSVVRGTFDRTVATFSGHVPNVGTASSPGRIASPQPVFIVGMPRSGTSLVEQILASHSQVQGAGELTLLGDSVNAIGWNTRELSRQQIESVRASYLSGIARLGGSKRFVTDKMPTNFWRIGFICAALPEAKIVHIRRDPRAVCWSLFRQYFPKEGMGFANDLQDIVEYYRMYSDLMTFWHGIFPDRICDLQYESLTEDQQGQTRSLLEHVGLPFEQACLEFHRTARAVQTVSRLQVRQKMFQGSSNEWRRYEDHLAPAFARLGERV